MNHDSLTIGVRHEPRYAIVTAAGEIDIFTVTRLRDQLFTLAADGRPLIADLDRVTFLGAAGLGALAAWTAPCGSPAPWPKRYRPCPPPRTQPPGRHSPSRPGPEVTTMTMTEPGFPSLRGPGRTSAARERRAHIHPHGDQHQGTSICERATLADSHRQWEHQPVTFELAEYILFMKAIGHYSPSSSLSSVSSSAAWRRFRSSRRRYSRRSSNLILRWVPTLR